MGNQVMDEVRVNSDDNEEVTEHVNSGSDSDNAPILDDAEQTGGNTNRNRPMVLYGEPEIGMIFDNDEEAYQFYCSYARSVGFKVRKRRQNQNKRGEIWKREYSCSCEGFYCKKRSPQKKREERRFGCKAILEIRLNQSKKYVVTKFEAEHTHSLAPLSNTHVLYRDSSPMAQFGELCQIAHRITSEAAKNRNSYTYVKSELLKLEEKLKSPQHTGKEDARRNCNSGSENRTNEDGVHLQDAETHKYKGPVKGKIKNALGSKGSKKEASSVVKDSKGPETHAQGMRPMSGPSNPCENGSIGLEKDKELVRSSLCLGTQIPLGFPSISADQGIPYHLPGYQMILPMIPNRSYTFAQESIQPRIPRPQGPVRPLRVSSSAPSRSYHLN